MFITFSYIPIITEKNLKLKMYRYIYIYSFFQCYILHNFKFFVGKFI